MSHADALERIRAARARIAAHVRDTPTVLSYTLSESTGAEVYLKLENLQRTGAFKIRGALNKLLLMPAAERERGVLAASAGNHAQGVALAARICDVAATIVMPEGTPLVKVQRTEGYGAEVILHGQSYDEAQARARELVAQRGAALIHPFDDRDIIEGQGTVGLELLEQVPELSAVLVPVGGGGLISGVALALRALAPEVKIIGVQASGAAATARSFRAGAPVRVPDPRTMADGIRVGTVGELTFPLIRELVDDVVTVEEEEISEAVVQTMEKNKVVVEAAGSVGVAALMAGRFRTTGRVCAVLSGGNIDLNFLGRLIDAGLASAGRYHVVHLRMPDTPGQLQKVVAVLAETKTNILDVQHYRAGWKVPVGSVDVEILIETRNAREGARVDELLLAEGFELLSSR
jgi:threonine dehydratase